MSPLTQTLLTTACGIVSAMILLWIVATLKRDVSIVDPFWGFGFVLTAWLAIGTNISLADPRAWLLVGLTTAWGMRLSIFLLWRNWGQGEDRRYVAMRKKRGVEFWCISLFTVFLLQGAIMWMVSIPVQIIVATQDVGPPGWLDAIGVIIWSVGLFFETVGDWQMAQFQSNPNHSDRVMDRGLWRFTRHPNYFGDFCIWWGIYFVAATGGAWWTIFSPLLMSVLLLKVSGVSLLESTITERRPQYEEYRRRTNAFFPGPRRNP